MKSLKYRLTTKYLLLLLTTIIFSSNVLAREYGEILSIHSGDTNSQGKAIFECHVKIKRESDNEIIGWLQVSSSPNIGQPNGCAILLAAYVSDKRIGYDLNNTLFRNICLADKIDC